MKKIIMIVCGMFISVGAWADDAPFCGNNARPNGAIEDKICNGKVGVKCKAEHAKKSGYCFKNTGTYEGKTYDGVSCPARECDDGYAMSVWPRKGVTSEGIDITNNPSDSLLRTLGRCFSPDEIARNWCTERHCTCSDGSEGECKPYLFNFTYTVGQGAKDAGTKYTTKAFLPGNKACSCVNENRPATKISCTYNYSATIKCAGNGVEKKIDDFSVKIDDNNVCAEIMDENGYFNESKAQEYVNNMLQDTYNENAERYKQEVNKICNGSGAAISAGSGAGAGSANVQSGIDAAQISSATSSLNAFLQDIDENKSVWKTADGKFNAARLASDLTAGVVLGTVGGVVSGVVIKKNQVKRGFEALHCAVGGQNVADWGDTFSVGLRK